MTKLPRLPVPEEIIPGVVGWRTDTGVTVLRVHYTADPDRCTDEWMQMQLMGYKGGKEGNDWLQEMEIDFSAYGGKPVFPKFSNTSIKQTEYNPDLPMWRGWDFGYRHPACTWWQLWPDDTLVALHELYPTLDPIAIPGVSVRDFGQLVKEETERLFPQATRPDGPGVFDYGDPSGVAKKDTSDFSAVEQLSQMGIGIEWVSVGRKNRVNYLRKYVEGQNRLRINPHCTLLIEALRGAYRYPEEDKVRQGGRDPDMPDVGPAVQKEPYIHIVDSMEYMAACRLATEYEAVDTPWNPLYQAEEKPKLQLHGSALDCVADWYKNRWDPDTVVDEDRYEWDDITLSPVWLRD